MIKNSAALLEIAVLFDKSRLKYNTAVSIDHESDRFVLEHVRGTLGHEEVIAVFEKRQPHGVSRTITQPILHLISGQEIIS